MKTISEITENVYKEIHRHPKQLVAFLVDAWLTVVAFGRGTGKTHGVTATWVYLRAMRLPRSTGFILSITYAHLIDTIIPAMQKSWNDMGLVEGVHYWIREKPPEELELDQPITPVDNPSYFIFWINGSVTKLVSMDRQAMVNSKSFDYGAIAEARKQNGTRIEDDVIPTIRGNDDRFGHIPEHGSILIESDLPKDQKGKWWIKYKKEMDEETVGWIMQIQYYIYELQKMLKIADEDTARSITKKIEAAREQMDEMRKDLVHWIEAGTFDNIHALGEKALRYLKRTLPKDDYDVSVLNILKDEVDDCMYAGLDDEVHGYDAFDYTHIDRLEKLPQQNCLWDKDCNLHQNLDITIDWNMRHSCIDVSQFVNNKIKLLKHHFVLAPKTEDDLVDEICEYYSAHKTKTVNFIYNHTFTAGEKVRGRTSIQKKIEDRFIANGWKVIKKPLGQAWWHEDIYSAFQKVINGHAPFQFRFNRNNCEVWYKACKDTNIVPNIKPITTNTNRRVAKFYKNKASERLNSGIAPQNATHATESVDQLIQYHFTKKSIDGQKFFGVAVS